MTSIDDLFKRPFLPSSGAGPATNKRKYEPSDAESAYKSAKLSDSSDAKGGSSSQASVAEEESEDDVEAGPEMPPEEEEVADDEEGRFFGGGVTKSTTAAMNFIDQADEENYVPEKIDVSWLRRLAINFERKINRNAELRAKHEGDPAKFMASEADLDTEIKSLSILSQHTELYAEFAKVGCAGSLVSLLAHENTDIAIDAMEIISELTDQDVDAETGAWDSFVAALLDSDLVNLIVQNFDRLDENLESDRAGVYHALSVLENLASNPVIAGKIGSDLVLNYLIRRIQAREKTVSQNKQYAAEVLQVLVQSSSQIQDKLIKDNNGVDLMVTLVGAYRRLDPERDSTDEEYAEDLFDALTVILQPPAGKKAFIVAEGIELAIIMVKNAGFSKTRALKLLDHAMAGPSDESRQVAERVVEAAGLKVLFGTFSKEGGKDKAALEHLIGIFSALLRLLPGESSHRIRTLAKFVEKDFAKLAKLVSLRFDYAARVRLVDQQIATERKQLSKQEIVEREDDWFSRRMDVGLYCLQTLDVILSWLVAEDAGARKKTIELLKDRDEGLADLKKSLQVQLDGVDATQEGHNGDMLQALIDCLA